MATQTGRSFFATLCGGILCGLLENTLKIIVRCGRQFFFHISFVIFPRAPHKFSTKVSLKPFRAAAKQYRVPQINFLKMTTFH